MASNSLGCKVNAKNKSYELRDISIYIVESCGPFLEGACDLMEVYQLILTIIIKGNNAPIAELKVTY